MLITAKNDNGISDFEIVSNEVSTCNHCLGAKEKPSESEISYYNKNKVNISAFSKEPIAYENLSTLHDERIISPNSRIIDQSYKSLNTPDSSNAFSRPSILLSESGEQKKRFSIANSAKLTLNKKRRSILIVPIGQQKSIKVIRTRVNTNKSCHIDIHTKIPFLKNVMQKTINFSSGKTQHSLRDEEQNSNNLKFSIPDFDMEGDTLLKLRSFKIGRRNAQIIKMCAQKSTVIEKSDELFGIFLQNFKCMKNQNQFSFRKNLGKGAFGQVLECVDMKRNNIIVAIKLYKYVTKTENYEINEVKILTKIKKEDPSSFNHCATLLEWFKIDDRPCLVFRKYGDNLYNFMKERKFNLLPFKVVLEISYQIFYACMFLHDKCQIIHTDLKPENIVFKSSIYISKEERGSKFSMMPSKLDIKIIDFGNAVMKKSSTFTKTIGTRNYRALEVILGQPWDEKADCWSIGCILYELYTCRVLFKAKNDINHLAMIDKIIGPINPSSLKNNEMVDIFLSEKNDIQHFEDFKTMEAAQMIQFHFVQTSYHSKIFTNMIIDLLKNDPTKRAHVREILKSPLFNILPKCFKRKYGLKIT